MYLLQEHPQLYQCVFSWVDPNFNLSLILGRNGVHFGGIYAVLALLMYTAFIAIVTLFLKEILEVIEERNKGRRSEASSVEMADPAIVDRMCLALWASGLWLRYATLQNLIPWRNPRKGRDKILPSGNPVVDV